METTRRQMMFMVGAAGAVVAAPSVMRSYPYPQSPETTIVAETSATIRVPVAVMDRLGLRTPVYRPAKGDEDAFERNRGWYRDVKFKVVGLDHVKDPDDRDLYRRLSRGAVAYPGVTVPKTPIEALGKRVTDMNYDIRERAMYVTYRLWAAPVAVTEMVFHSEAHGLEMDVFYHTQEIMVGDYKDPFAKA